MQPFGEIFSLPFWFSITCGTQLSFWSAVKPGKRVFATHIRIELPDGTGAIGLIGVPLPG